MSIKFFIIILVSLLALVLTILGILINARPQIFYKRFYAQYFLVAGALIVLNILLAIFA